MENKNVIQNNKTYWDTNADLWFGATALPKYGVKFVTEDDLHLFGDVSGKKNVRNLLWERPFIKIPCR